jgi:hypothetical protein
LPPPKSPHPATNNATNNAANNAKLRQMHTFCMITPLTNAAAVAREAHKTFV